jgi:glycyl-tRNA synthetase beta chain
MPQFLLELFSEEIPARMQKRGAEDLKKLLMDALTKAGFMPTGIETFSAPRRLTAVVEGLPARTADVSEERKGPKVGSPEQALAGFLRGAGLTDISQARIVEDAKKGDYYVADIVKAGQATPDAIAAIIPDIIRNFPWPKSMRWGEGSLRWVRPLHRIVAIFDGEIVPFDVDGIASANITEGHRFHGNGTFSVRDYDDYEAKLSAAHVVLDRDVRKAQIKADAKTLCEARNLELIDDEGLLEEVCGLVDEPHVIMGDMDPAFLDLPPEVIRLTLRVNQKYFVVRDPKTGGLAPHFIVVSNVAATDGGKLIAQGNARVLAARLNDARYFWDLDRKASLESRVAKLDTLVFHEKLGSVGDKVRRIVELAGQIAPLVGADVDVARRAALLCKADLTTEMVGEFPELQGVMGRYYALSSPPQSASLTAPPQAGRAQAQNPVLPRPTGEVARSDGGGVSFTEPTNIADAIRDHYKPIGPSDNVPTDPVAVAVALADKLDSLVGFFAIGEKPTGAGDPFALRRAALGVIRILRETKIVFPLLSGLDETVGVKVDQDMEEEVSYQQWFDRQIEESRGKVVLFNSHPKRQKALWEAWFPDGFNLNEIPNHTSRSFEVTGFILDRLRVTLRDEGFAPDILEAAFAVQDDDINRIVARVTALSSFLKTEDGKNLSAGYKRASNILKAEDKKGALPDSFAIDAKALELKEEMALNDALAHVQVQLPDLLTAENFDGAMTALSTLRTPVDAFFDAVLVNDPDPAKRLNRLALLASLRDATLKVADFEKIAG